MRLKTRDYIHPGDCKFFHAALVFLYLFLCIPRGFSQASDEVQQFITGSIADKTRIILRIDLSSNTSERVRRLPRDAIEFVLANREDLGDIPELENLFLAALGKIQGNSAEDITLLTGLLASFTTGRSASAIMTRLYDFASANPAQMKQTVPGLNLFLQNNFAELRTNAEIIRSAIKTLSLCGDSSSFNILLEYALQKQDTQTALLAENALVTIKDGLEQNIARVLSDRPVSEKLYIFRLIQGQNNFSAEFKAKCAENALTQAITIVRDSNTASEEVIALQTESLNAIVRYEWTQSSALVLSLFPVAQREYDAGILSEDRFIQVIQAQGTLGVSGAGQVLSNYLAVLNSITEKSESVSAAVVLALINTLGTLGDKTAFDNLLYVTYLDYNSAVIQSAREALTKLKW